jgi:hypothetical protein
MQRFWHVFGRYPGSNFCWDTDCPEWDFPWFSSFLPDDCQCCKGPTILPDSPLPTTYVSLSLSRHYHATSRHSVFSSTLKMEASCFSETSLFRINDIDRSTSYTFHQCKRQGLNEVWMLNRMNATYTTYTYAHVWAGQHAGIQNLLSARLQPTRFHVTWTTSEEKARSRRRVKLFSRSRVLKFILRSQETYRRQFGKPFDQSKLRAERSEFDSRRRQEIFLYSTVSILAVGPTRPMGTGGLFPRG